VQRHLRAIKTASVIGSSEGQKAAGGLSGTGAILGIKLERLAEVIGKPTKFCGFKYSKPAFAMKPKLTLSPRAR
jgi:hypothetical protein